MIEHQVWFKIKAGVPDAEVQAMVRDLRALAPAVPGIERLAAGFDFSGRSRDYSIGLAVTFDDRAALEAYGPHPRHQEFVSRYRDLWEDVIALDFEG